MNEESIYKTMCEVLIKTSKLEERLSESLLQISKLEARVSELEKARQDSPIGTVTGSGGGRDNTHYLFNGRIYGKNRLVLAVVKEYVSTHPSVTVKQLQQVFDKSLQGSLGVVMECNEAKLRSFDYQTRFFVKDDEIIHLTDGDMYVCTQWGIGNLPNFLHRAKELGFEIKSI